ncbi:MAG: RNA pyrophosphohydrolase [Pseudomonadota bacterium]
MSDLRHHKPRRGYRPCVGIALFAQDGRVFMGKRSQKGAIPQFSWQMPQGGIDGGEGALQAALRELYEETSVKSVRLAAEIEGWLHYDLPAEVGAFRGRYRGQAQRWFAFRFEGADDEIDVVNPPDGHSQEFSRWRWQSLEETPALVVPFKRAVYETVVEGFMPLTQPPLRGAPSQAI